MIEIKVQQQNIKQWVSPDTSIPDSRVQYRHSQSIIMARNSAGQENFMFIGVVILGAAVLVSIFWTKSAEVVVTGHRWERSIEIQAYQAIKEDSWCDQVPAEDEAYDMRQEQRERGTTQVQDGEDCSNVNIDNGDGRVRLERHCQPRYRSEPTIDTYCHYTVNRWVNQGWVNNQGKSTDPPPSWPQAYQAIKEGSWCDQMPAEAYDMRQEQQERGTTQVQDGKDCSNVDVDNGDGNVRKERHCKPRYRSEPTYDTYCHYTVNRWVNQGWVNNQGKSTDPAPSWPQLSVVGCKSIGCTRQGTQRSLNVLIYKITSDGTVGTTHECNYDESVWRDIEVGTRQEAQFRVVGGGMVCSSVGGTGL